VRGSPRQCLLAGQPTRLPACVIWFYNILNVIWNNIQGTEAELYIAVEPLLFGLSYMAIDMVFITMKNTMKNIISDAKEKSK
jgi:hypothetical protein